MVEVVPEEEQTCQIEEAIEITSEAFDGSGVRTR
jgi:hypothetical protein